MAIVGFEAIAVVAILLMVFLWGPQKLPEMAKSIGLAKREFERAGQEMTSPSAPTSHEKDSSDPLIVAAKSLGISTEGKTKAELIGEISTKTQA